MAFSSGTYTLPGPALSTGDTVSATENNTLRNDMASSFNLTWLRNGTAAATADIPMGGYKITGLAAATSTGDALAYGRAATVTDLTTTGNTILGDASTDTLNVGNGGLIKDASGNVGVGVTPSAWSTYKVFEFTTGGVLWSPGAAAARLGSNYYYNGTNFIYKASNNATDYRQNTGAHEWHTAASGTAGNAITFTQAMTLDASNNLLVGTTSQILSAKISLQTSGGRGYSFNDTSSGAGTKAMVFGSGGTEVGSISTTSVSTSYNTTSDQRLKENIFDAPEFGSVIDSIQVRSYDWRTNQKHQRAGFIAQELVTVAPEAVHQPANPEEMMAVDYSKLVPMLVKEIQSLRQRVAQLESN